LPACPTPICPTLTCPQLNCDADGTLLQGESNSYTIGGTTYAVTVTNILYQSYAGGVYSADFIINGVTYTVLEDETVTLSDGTTLTVTSILFQDYAGGVKRVSFCMKKRTALTTCNEVLELVQGESKWAQGLSATGGNISLTYIDSEKIKVNVDGGVPSSFIPLGQEATVGVLKVRPLNILYQNYAGGVHQTTLCIN